MKEINLCLINVSDLSNLRQWKNDNREAFFYKDEISPEQQYEWFCAYQERHDDYMFIVLVNDIGIGCIGARLIDNEWDIYNVILHHKYRRKGLMSKALKELIYVVHLYKLIPITVKVLKNNSTVNWYKKNEFVITSKQSDHYCMSYEGDL